MLLGMIFYQCPHYLERVRCSGVIGIDEKFVKVPKNDKPKSKMSRWMYVYVAVDCYTYDLLHIQIYAHRNEATARAFLLELLLCQRIQAKSSCDRYVAQI